MEKTIYAVNSKISKLLSNYLLVNHNNFSIEKIIPEKFNFDEIIIDISKDELIKIKELITTNLPSPDLLLGAVLKNCQGTKIIEEIDKVLAGKEECPVCKRISSKPLESKCIQEKDGSMYIDEIFTCGTCNRFSSNTIHAIMDDSNPTEKYYKCLDEERGSSFKLYEEPKKPFTIK